MSAGRIAAIIGGVLLVLIGLAFIAPGGFLLWAYGTQRDSSGFFESSERVVSTNGYALTSPDVNVKIASDVAGWVPKGSTAAVRIQAASMGSNAVFVGIGPADRVSEYLAGVTHDEISDFNWWGGVSYRHVEGNAAPSAPARQDFWVAQQEGAGSQSLEWEVQDGQWTAVIMNADAARDVTANVGLGGRFGLILPIGIALTAAGVVLFGLGITLIVLGIVLRPTPPPAPTVPATQAPPAEPPPPGVPPREEPPPPGGPPPGEQPPPGGPAPPASR